MDSVAVPDEEIAKAARLRAGARSARVVARAPFGGGGSGAHFAHLVLEIDGARRAAVLKEIAPDPIGPTLERRFYEELAPRIPLRVPALLASGPLAGTAVAAPRVNRPSRLRQGTKFIGGSLKTRAVVASCGWR